MKILISVILALLLLCSIFLTGCDNDFDPTESSTDTNDAEEPHKHIYEGSWIAEEAGHYKVSTCHPDVKELAQHRDSVDIDGKCDVCHYTLKTEDVFTVTIKDKLGNFISGVSLKIYTSTGERELVTDENGTASCGFVYYDSVRLIIKGAPSGFEGYVDQLYDFDTQNLDIVFENN